MAAPAPPWQPERHPRKPRHRARYELREEIGTGGMGTVYRALDRELNRIVAVKVLRPELVPNLANLLHMKRELVLASRVSDEHVVRVYDMGQVDGRTLISMDWIDGETLLQLLRRVHALPPSQVLGFATQIAQALRAIHAAHIVHRDLKPDNLLIRSDGAILVSDFGLARSVLPQDFAVTRQGDVGGAPSYMAPEQLAGLPVDARSDLYSFGVVLLEMLTGTTALESLAPVRQRILSAELDNYSRSSELRSLAALDLVIRRCLCLDRAERYPSVDLALQDLTMAHVEASSTQTPPACPWYRGLLRSRSRKIAFSAALVLLLAIGAYITRQFQARRSAETERLYLEAMTNITAATDTPELRASVEKLHQVVVRSPGHTAAARAEVDTLIRLFERTRDEQWLQRASHALSGASAAALSPDERTLLRARIDLNQGLFAKAIEALQHASALLSRSEEANRLLGKALTDSHQIEASLQFFQAAIRLSPESWLAHNEMGASLAGLGRIKDAEQEFLRVIHLRPQSPIGYDNLGSVLFYQGRFSEARKNFESSLQLVPSGAAYYNLGLVSFFSREYAISTTFYERAIEMRPSADLYVVALADSLRHLHRAKAARDRYAQALALLEQQSQTRRLTIEQQSRRAICLARLGDLNAAASILNAFSSEIKNQDVSYARAIVAMLEGRHRDANRHLKEATQYGCPYNFIDLNPDFDDLPL